MKKSEPSVMRNIKKEGDSSKLKTLKIIVPFKAEIPFLFFFTSTFIGSMELNVDERFNPTRADLVNAASATFKLHPKSKIQILGLTVVGENF